MEEGRGAGEGVMQGLMGQGQARGEGESMHLVLVVVAVVSMMRGGVESGVDTWERGTIGVQCQAPRGRGRWKGRGMCTRRGLIFPPGRGKGRGRGRGRGRGTYTRREGGVGM